MLESTEKTPDVKTMTVYRRLQSQGFSYQGDLMDDEIHGHGILEWPDGTSFTGSFKKGVIEGDGKFTFTDGATLVGVYSEGWLDGDGTYTWSDGAQYTGPFSREKLRQFGPGIGHFTAPIKNVNGEEHTYFCELVLKRSYGISDLEKTIKRKLEEKYPTGC